MEVGELKKVLEGLDDRMKVGVIGHYGECNEFDCLPSVEKGRKYDGKKELSWLGFEHVDIGSEPE